MKILIAGYGSIGRRHYRNLRALGVDDIIFYRTGHSQLATDEIEDAVIETDLVRALTRKPDAVIVANPTALHLETALATAEASCDLLIEKPLSHSLSGVEALEAAVRQHGIHVLMGYQFRFHPGIIAMKKAVAEGVIGDPLRLQAHWGEFLPGWHPWEDYRSSYSAQAALGGGVLLTLCHPLNYLRWIFGEIETVTASVGNLSSLELDVEDNADLMLQFINGISGSVHLDYYQRPATHRVEIIGSNGTLRWNQELFKPQIFLAESGQWTSSKDRQPYDRNNMFLEEMRHFLDVIAGKVEPVSSLQDGIRDLEICMLAYRSSEQEKTLHVSGLQ